MADMSTVRFEGKISKLFPSNGYGFIRTRNRPDAFFLVKDCDLSVFSDGRELTVGMDVTYIEIVSEKGMRAQEIRLKDGK